MTQNSIWKMVCDLEDKNVVLEQSVLRLEAQNVNLVKALKSLSGKWMAEAERTRQDWYNDSAAFEQCSEDLDDLLKEHCQHLNKELVNMSDVMCTDCVDMVNHELERKEESE